MAQPTDLRLEKQEGFIARGVFIIVEIATVSRGIEMVGKQLSAEVGTIVSIGPNAFLTEPGDFAVGDKVFFRRYGGSQFSRSGYTEEERLQIVEENKNAALSDTKPFPPDELFFVLPDADVYLKIIPDKDAIVFHASDEQYTDMMGTVDPVEPTTQDKITEEQIRKLTGVAASDTSFIPEVDNG